MSEFLKTSGCSLSILMVSLLLFFSLPAQAAVTSVGLSAPSPIAAGKVVMFMAICNISDGQQNETISWHYDYQGDGKVDTTRVTYYDDCDDTTLTEYKKVDTYPAKVRVVQERTSSEGTDTFNITIVAEPTGEITTFNGWGSGVYATWGLWKGQLQPTDLDFSGIQVTERDRGGGVDTCHWPDSDYPALDHITPGDPWDVGANNYWCCDHVGYLTYVVTYYREQGRTPCGFNVHQAMDVVGTNYNYANHDTVGEDITDVIVKTKRAGEEAWKTW